MNAHYAPYLISVSGSLMLGGWEGGGQGEGMTVLWREQDVAAHWKSLGGQVGDIFMSRVLHVTEK